MSPYEQYRNFAFDMIEQLYFIKFFFAVSLYVDKKYFIALLLRIQQLPLTNHENIMHFSAV